jgi:hypothetical protein
MISALISGQLIEAPTTRTSRNGNPFVTAKLKANDGDGSCLVSLVAFDEDVCGSLLALSKGDSVAVSGACKATAWIDKERNAAAGLNCVVKVVMSLYGLKKKRQVSADTGLPPVNAHPGLKRCSLDNDFEETDAPF